MKILTIKLFKVIIFFLTIIILSGNSYSQTKNGFHFIIADTYGMFPIEYIFRNINDDMPYITSFPMESLIEDSFIKSFGPEEDKKGKYFLVNVNTGEGETKKLQFRYWIFTSVSDAEYYLVPRLYIYSYRMDNAIDLGRAGEIGDNCWFGAKYHRIAFIRNNILVDIKIDHYTSDNHVEVYEFAKKVDTLLRSSDKVKDVKLIPSPIINLVEINSQIQDFIYFKINAIDPKGQNLRYQCLWGKISDEDIIQYNTKAVENVEERKRVKIFVWNEDRIVSSHDYF